MFLLYHYYRVGGVLLRFRVRCCPDVAVRTFFCCPRYCSAVGSMSLLSSWQPKGSQGSGINIIPPKAHNLLVLEGQWGDDVYITFGIFSPAIIPKVCASLPQQDKIPIMTNLWRQASLVSLASIQRPCRSKATRLK